MTLNIWKKRKLMVDRERKIKVVAVSYLNTKPLLAGLRQSSIANQLVIEEANPGACAEKMKAGEADIALIPVAAIPDIPNTQIISNYCIGASGNVGSVCLFSEVPMEEIDTVLLDYQSRTSVALCQLLINKHWQRSIQFKDTTQGYIEDIKGRTAGLVIGDRTFDLKSQMPYCYDLADAWMEYTNLPFVFANWLSRVSLSNEFLIAFDQALAAGLDGRKQLAQRLQSDFPTQNVEDYFMNKIDYDFNETKRLGLQRFYNELELEFVSPIYLPSERAAR